jgi:hypothetical protein
LSYLACCKWVPDKAANVHYFSKRASSSCPINLTEHLLSPVLAERQGIVVKYPPEKFLLVLENKTGQKWPPPAPNDYWGLKAAPNKTWLAVMRGCNTSAVFSWLLQPALPTVLHP